jgi:hypothetical protein
MDRMDADIQGLREALEQAHRGTSFSPDKRADMWIRDIEDELREDLAELGERAGDYRAKYLQHVRTWIARKGRCLSPMIAGPANFPAERNRKAFNSERKAWDEFREWRARWIKRANREPTKSPEEEIDDAVLKLEKERNAHTLMVEINKIHRRKVSDDEKRKALAEELELSPGTVEKLMVKDEWHGYGFAPFELTNSNARIKNLEQKVLVMKNRIARRDAFEPIAFPGGSIDIEDDRVVIRHESKPARDIIESLKSKGFMWSPSRKAWVRKHTANAIAAARAVVGL